MGSEVGCSNTHTIMMSWRLEPESSSLQVKAFEHFLLIFECDTIFRYWALAVPAYAMMTVVLALGFYCGVNFMSTPPPSSLYTVYGES